MRLLLCSFSKIGHFIIAYLLNQGVVTTIFSILGAVSWQNNITEIRPKIKNEKTIIIPLTETFGLANLYGSTINLFNFYTKMVVEN